MTWLSIALALLRITDNLVAWARERGLLEQGKDAEIAEVSAAILSKTETGKAILAKVQGMTEEQVDKALKELEP